MRVARKVDIYLPFACDLFCDLFFVISSVVYRDLSPALARSSVISTTMSSAIFRHLSPYLAISSAIYRHLFSHFFSYISPSIAISCQLFSHLFSHLSPYLLPFLQSYIAIYRHLSLYFATSSAISPAISLAIYLAISATISSTIYRYLSPSFCYLSLSICSSLAIYLLYIPISLPSLSVVDLPSLCYIHAISLRSILNFSLLPISTISLPSTPAIYLRSIRYTHFLPFVSVNFFISQSSSFSLTYIARLYIVSTSSISFFAYQKRDPTALHTAVTVKRLGSSWVARSVHPSRAYRRVLLPCYQCRYM
jgi:hypothetical protein